MTDNRGVTPDIPAATWLDRAKCRHPAARDVHHPTIRRPDARTAEPDDAYSEARLWCRWCPVTRDCLDYAMDVERTFGRSSRYGMYGGMTPGQRDRLHQEEQRARQRDQPLPDRDQWIRLALRWRRVEIRPRPRRRSA